MFDRILGAIIEKLRTVSTLKKECFTLCDIGQLLPQSVNLGGRDQRW